MKTAVILVIALALANAEAVKGSWRATATHYSPAQGGIL